MKFAAVALGLVCSGMAFGQSFTHWPGLAEAVRSKQKSRPLEPTGSPPQNVRSGKLPPPLEDPEDLILKEQKGTVTNKNGIIQARGGSHILYKGYDLFADEIDIDTHEEFAILRGNVKVIGKDSIINGGLVRVNFKDRSFTAEDGYAILRPSFTGGRVQGDMFVRGATGYGTEKQFHTHDGGITTCDLEHPHYTIEARDNDVRPRKRLVLRDAKIKIGGRTILGFPYLSVPLEDRSDRYMPEVGQSQDEGYFAKFKIPIALKDSLNFLDGKLDLMSKLGTGVGANYEYDGRARGRIRAYTLLGNTRQTTELAADHSQRFGKLFTAFNMNYQRANYASAPENTTFNTLLRLNYGPSALNYSRYENNSPNFSNTQQVVGFTDNRISYTYDKVRGRTSMEFTYSGYQSRYSGGTSDRELLDVRMKHEHDAPIGTTAVEYLRSIPFGTITGFQGGTERTPVISFKSDTRKFLGKKWTELMPITTDLSWGQFSNPSTGRHITRTFMELGTQLIPVRGDDRFNVRMDTRYRQGIYSDDTAQYSTLFNGLASYRLGPSRNGYEPSINLRYNFLDFHGYTPLDIDRTGRANYTSLDVMTNPARRLMVGLSTGYDFNQEKLQNTAWQTLGVRTEWEPLDGFKLRSLSTYDPFQKAWSNVRLDVPSFKLGTAVVAAGARYDGLRHTWGAANLYVDGLRYKRFTFSMLLSYNGYLKEFEARHFSLTYDLHCAEAVLQVLDNPIGFRSGRTIYFFFRLKALPFNTPFGLGRTGTSFGTGTGRDGF